MTQTVSSNRSQFKKILIANRGEIALRIIRTANVKGLATVAIYSQADCHALHTRLADEAWLLGDSAPGDSYLNSAKIIDIALQSGAQAVHPGYGFLAENSKFAQACLDAGLVFIGPSPEAIAAMGDKAKAKQLMRAAGVPCIDGYEGPDQTAAALAPMAELIGLPVMIKAAAGGGGRGMRLVRHREEFDALLASAQSEALSAFGDATVLLEKAIVNPRHIEIQVVADRFGNVIHLGERDCSIQRRHQKIIEETPSPAVSVALRNTMGDIAIRASKAISYEGVGTFEFLLDELGQFYFMEMNTRLQVEHPVTEAITGLDLVALQIDIANGQALPFTQDQVRFEGHAIEVRLCAEDPQQNFTPQSGELITWHEPTGLRVDHALESGIAISPYYDSMIAKIISHGKTRQEACDQLDRGLQNLIAFGVPTNQDFLLGCLTNSAFKDGQFNTGFIEQHSAELFSSQIPCSPPVPVVAAALLVGTNGAGESQPLPHPYPISLKFHLGKTHHATALHTKHGLRITYGTSVHNLVVVSESTSSVVLVEHKKSQKIVFTKKGANLYFRVDGKNFQVIDERYLPTTSNTAVEQDGACRANTNGKIVSIHAAMGDSVVIGQPLVTIEAMKMEHVHTSGIHGTIESVRVLVGDQVKQRQSLLIVKPIP
jgi:geranyl-CoA carboxylase alpha subunit